MRTALCWTTAAAATLVPTVAWAQRQPATVDKAPKSFAPNYLLVLMLVALALFSVCKPSFREDKPKPRYD